LWKAGSWEPGPLIPRDRRELWGAPAAFRRDGRVLAIARSFQHVRLLDFADRREIATLATPDLPVIDSWFCFSPDGDLLAVATESHSVQLWDLGAIGRQLREMGLDCDLLPASPPRPTGGPAPRVRVFQEVFEAEHLPVVASSACTYAIQDMKPWGRENWSNGKQLLCHAQKGGFVELEVELPAAGRYALSVSLTRMPSAGRVEVAVDGRKIGVAFDGFDARIAASVPVPLGTLELQEGGHRLRFAAVDKAAGSGGYDMGIDCLRLIPRDPPEE
jgi:hypothetical protein